MQVSFEKSSYCKQQFFSWLYVYLSQQMRVIVQKLLQLLNLSLEFNTERSLLQDIVIGKYDMTMYFSSQSYKIIILRRHMAVLIMNKMTNILI